MTIMDSPITFKDALARLREAAEARIERDEHGLPIREEPVVVPLAPTPEEETGAAVDRIADYLRQRAMFTQRPKEIHSMREIRPTVDAATLLEDDLRLLLASYGWTP